MARKKVEYIEGFTKSAWKSLVIKAIRIGWVQGLEKASTVLSKSEMINLLLGSMFEDVFPTGTNDLNEAFHEIMNQEYTKLCSRNTLHGRGYAQAFFDMAEEACSESAKTVAHRYADEIIKRTDIRWLNPRIYNCLYTWAKIRPTGENYHREPLNYDWAGMPLNILDEHTFEGKVKGRKICLLSGHYENHLAIGNRVMAEGWNPIRFDFITDEVVQGYFPEPKLF